MSARSGELPAAIDSYLAYLDAFPQGEEAPFAAWWAAALSEQLQQTGEAITLYQDLAQNYAWHEDAPEALFRAGWLAHNGGDVETAADLWRQSAEQFPNSHYGSASLFWLIKLSPEEQPAANLPRSTAQPDRPEPLHGYPGEEEDVEPTVTPSIPTIEELVSGNRADNYYALRARDLVEEVPPFVPAVQLNLPQDESAAQAEAEAWLINWLSLDPDTDPGQLSPQLAGDSRLQVGQKLWHLGLLEEAKGELEALRRDYVDNPLASYQLALFFRDLGLYRSSIIAATSLISLSDQSLFDVPRFIGRLAYPVYYADIIIPLAEKYGFDPLLQFALVRQESLFESFARSGAAAQGLAQVIPDTGAYIAQQLGWPEYENEDLYKPYVGLAFGAYYLHQQLRSFDGHVHAALSAYNAGPGNAARWYEVAGGDHDQYLETVNFAETHLYIERIYVGHVIYRYLYGHPAE